jgi:hypothetical protein
MEKGEGSLQTAMLGHAIIVDPFKVHHHQGMVIAFPIIVDPFKVHHHQGMVIAFPIIVDPFKVHHHQGMVIAFPTQQSCTVMQYSHDDILPLPPASPPLGPVCTRNRGPRTGVRAPFYI